MPIRQLATIEAVANKPEKDLDVFIRDWLSDEDLVLDFSRTTKDIRDNVSDIECKEIAVKLLTVAFKRRAWQLKNDKGSVRKL